VGKNFGWGINSLKVFHNDGVSGIGGTFRKFS
jgi:hypothetical protein